MPPPDIHHLAPACGYVLFAGPGEGGLLLLVMDSFRLSGSLYTRLRCVYPRCKHPAPEGCNQTGRSGIDGYNQIGSNGGVVLHAFPAGTLGDIAGVSEHMP
jgi:hypothetical protein